MRKLSKTENDAVDKLCLDTIGQYTIECIRKAQLDTVLRGASSCIREALADSGLDMVKAASNKDFVSSVLFIATYMSPNIVEEPSLKEMIKWGCTVCHTKLDQDLELD